MILALFDDDTLAADARLDERARMRGLARRALDMSLVLLTEVCVPACIGIHTHRHPHLAITTQ